MAAFAISFVANRLADVLNQIRTHKDVHRIVDRLQAELKRMQCFLKDADDKQEDDKRVHNWISDISNAAYDADDLIDSFLLRMEIHKRRKFLASKFSSIKEWTYRAKVKEELEAIEMRIHNISVSCETYGISNFGQGTSRASEKLQNLRQSSPGEEKNIVGLDEDTARLVAQLVRKESQWRAFSIVGMGGIGKTTLAKRVYNHGDVRCRFNCQAWVYVSQQFRTRDILQGLLKQVATSQNWENLVEEDLEEMLYKYLLTKRYLVVLDDMWSTEAWDCLAKVFPNRGNGSRLMITSRNKSVALYADARTFPHELQLLNEEDSWELFCRKAFTDNLNKSCPPELEETGREIVGKCDGLPLAIIVLGGLVSRKRNLNEWERILSNIHAHFARNINGVEAILALSYKDLPQHLKWCFLYMGHFPEDHLIRTRKLVRLLVAEGLIPQQRGERMEDVAEDYLNELIDRNMVQVARMSRTERVKECRVHDLLRKLSISKAKAENFFEIHGNLSSLPSSSSRRHAIYSNFDWYASLSHSTKLLRSLFFFRLDVENRRIKELNFVCKNFKLLRVLDLEDIRIDCVPDGVGELIHLKYIGLRRTNIHALPSTLGSLHCLQTLDVAANVNLQIVPNVIWKMEALRHLYMCGPRYNEQLRVDTLQHLQTLSVIHVRNWMENNPVKLTNLWKLGIKGSFASHAHEIIPSFALLPRLQSLFLQTDDVVFPSLTAFSHLRFLTKLHMRGGIRNLPIPREFPPNLCQLTLNHSFLIQDPMEILEKLPKLLILKLKAYSFKGSKLAISANGFPQLKFLEFDFLEFLEELKIEEGAMQRLQCFRICNCRKLSTLPEEIKCVTTLQELEIKEMQKAFIDRLQGVDRHKVQHIPTLRLV
ncbi:unnamed protein product [Ilex paraguariensis]|uniref:Uncharacterized protein n=1 Tax=Ilex paraguariensis TaxID=185542 RepID=A0ABC8SVJ0_9AQUA